MVSRSVDFLLLFLEKVCCLIFKNLIFTQFPALSYYFPFSREQTGTSSTFCSEEKRIHKSDIVASGLYLMFIIGFGCFFFVCLDGCV